MTAPKNSARFANLLLLTAVLGVLSLELSGLGLRGLLQRRTQLQVNRQLLIETQQTQRSVEARRSALAKLTQAALSNNPSHAVSKYQQTLLSYGDRIGIQNLTIEPATPKRIAGVGHQTTCTLRGKMTSIQFAQLLDQMSRFETLHRVTGIQVLPLLRKQSNSGIRQVTLTSQIVTLLDATDKASVPTRDNSSSLTSVLRSHPIFTRYEPPASALQEPKVTPAVDTKFVANVVEPPPPVNHLRRLQFVAAFARDDQWRAWLYNSDLSQHFAVTTDDTLNSGSYRLRIGEVGADYLFVSSGDTEHRIELGEFLSK